VAGTYGGSRSLTACTLCEAGSYQDANGASACKKCPSRHHVTRDIAGLKDIQGASNALSCICREGFVGPPGHTVAPDGSRVCVACAAGHAKGGPSILGSEVCAPCSWGSFMPLTVATACVSCPNGSVPSKEGARATTCAACTAGKYSNASYSESCSMCPAGMFVSDTALLSKEVAIPHVLDEVPVRIGVTYVKLFAGATGCQACPVAKYSSVGSQNCSTCGGGTYGISTPGATSCLVCEPGQFQMFDGRTNCEACPELSVTKWSGASTMSLCVCVAGYYRVGSECVWCMKGKFKRSIGNEECEKCPIGKFQNLTAATICNLCARSYVTATTWKPITNSSISGGVWQGGEGRTSCLPCPNNSVTLVEASADVSKCLCDRGHVGSLQTSSTSSWKLTCVACPAGSAKSGISEDIGLQLSQPQSTSASVTEGRECEFCKAGKFAKMPGSTSCIFCELGKFQSLVMETSCISCPLNTTTNGTGAVLRAQCLCSPGFFRQTLENSNFASGGGDAVSGSGQCLECPAGKYSEEVGSACSECPSGKYSSIPASSVCTLCVAGDENVKSLNRASYQETLGQTTCILCPSPLHRTLTQGATSIAHCRCMPAYEGPDGAVNFSLSPDRSLCEPCRKGYYKNSITQGEWCQACEKGSFGPSPGLTACQKCPPTRSTAYQGSVSLSDCNCDVGFQYTVSATDNTETTKTTNTPSCLPCHAGTYKDDIANASCTRCPDFTNISLGMEVTAGANSIFQCICLQGYTSLPSERADPTFLSAQRCIWCARGSFKPLMGMHPCSPCPMGMYSIVPAATSCLPCAPGSFSAETGRSRCTECTAGTYTDVSGSTHCGRCPLGYSTGFAGAANCTVQCVGLADARPFEEKNREIADLKSQLSFLENAYQQLETDLTPCAEILKTLQN